MKKSKIYMFLAALALVLGHVRLLGAVGGLRRPRFAVWYGVVRSRLLSVAKGETNGQNRPTAVLRRP